MTIGLGHYLTVAAILFTFGIFGIFLNRKNVIVILMSIELILLAVNINLIAFSSFLGDLVGQIFALLVLTVAAAEAAIGLAILVPRSRIYLAALTVLAMGLRFGTPPQRIRNPKVVPVSMNDEGAGPKSPFWPSSAQTNTGTIIPADFFMDSKLCGECHKDIYEQWKGSMHHFASFNNQFYKASILHMQELSGVQGSKWCAACHDHAVCTISPPGSPEIPRAVSR